MADDLDDDIDDEPEGPDALDDDAEVLDEDDVDEVDAGDDAFVGDEFADTDDDLDDDEEEEVVKEAPRPKAAKGAKPVVSSDDDESGEDDDDEPDPDDVEADLDTILKDRLVVADDDEDDEEPLEPEDKGEGGNVRPRAPGEFVCQSCFLVKHPSQLADNARLLCRDCI